MAEVKSIDLLEDDQWDAIDRLWGFDATMLIAPKGFGKCVVSYTALGDLLVSKRLSRVLVLSTSNVCTDTWLPAPTEWPHLTQAGKVNAVCIAGLSADKRRKALDQYTNVVICNFENLRWLIQDSNHFHTFDGLLVDESTKLKSVGGKGFSALRKYITPSGNIKTPFKWRCVMTADAMAQNTYDIYGQALVCDGGKALGRNKENFMRKYFMPTDFNQTDWVLQPTKDKALAQALAPFTYRVTPEKYKESLPELRHTPVYTELSLEAREMYKTMARDGVTMIGDDEVVAPNAGVATAKMRQCCNGAMYYDVFDLDNPGVNDEGETVYPKIRKIVHFDYHKIDTAVELIQSFDTPVLVSYEFDYQKDALVAELDAPVYSAQLSRIKKKKLFEDWNAGKIPVLLVHPKSAGHGLNLQHGGHTLVNLAPFHSADEYDQIIGRLLRRGQPSAFVEVYDIICKSTLEDTRIVPRLHYRQAVSESIDKHLAEIRNV